MIQQNIHIYAANMPAARIKQIRHPTTNYSDILFISAQQIDYLNEDSMRSFLLSLQVIGRFSQLFVTHYEHIPLPL